MVLRVLNLVVACWALQISPSLCLAGLLTHPCNPNEDRTCATSSSHSERNHDQPDSGSCSHEDECNADPCQDSPVVKDGGDHPLGDATSLAALPGFTAPSISLARHEIHTCSNGPPNRPRLPLHQSDLPLLLWFSNGL